MNLNEIAETISLKIISFRFTCNNSHLHQTLNGGIQCLVQNYFKEIAGTKCEKDISLLQTSFHNILPPFIINPSQTQFSLPNYFSPQIYSGILISSITCSNSGLHHCTSSSFLNQVICLFAYWRVLILMASTASSNVKSPIK